MILRFVLFIIIDKPNSNLNLYTLNMVKVSLIVPVYNVEKYLARCLDYCINQSYQNLEVICINDGSTDNSLNILEHYKTLDNRIKVINKQNGGLSSARNVGISAAEGKYIMFVDSDDFISSIAVEKLVENAEQYDSDVVVFDYIINTGTNCIQFTVHDDIINSGEVFNIDTLDSFMYSKIPVSAWSKFYNADFLKNNNILYDEGLTFEDVAFYSRVYTRAKRISYLKAPFYSYTNSRDGQIMGRRDEKLFDVFKIYKIVQDTLLKSGYYEKCKLAVDLTMIRDIMWKFNIINIELKPLFFDKIKEMNLSINFDAYKNIKLDNSEEVYLKLYKILESVNTYDEFITVLERNKNG